MAKRASIRTSKNSKINISSRGLSTSRKINGVTFNSRDNFSTTLSKIIRASASNKSDASPAELADRKIEAEQEAVYQERLRVQRQNVQDMMVTPPARYEKKRGEGVEAISLPPNIKTFDARWGQHRLNNIFVDVVAEDYYPENMEFINRVFRNVEVMDDINAILLPEFTNENDSSAIMVLIEAGINYYQVGYLNRDAAREYFPVLNSFYEQGFAARIPVKLQHKDVRLLLNDPGSLTPLLLFEGAVALPANNVVAVLGENDDIFASIAGGADSFEFSGWLRADENSIKVMHGDNVLGQLSASSANRVAPIVAEISSGGGYAAVDVTAELLDTGRWEALVYLP